MFRSFLAYLALLVVAGCSQLPVEPARPVASCPVPQTCPACPACPGVEIPKLAEKPYVIALNKKDLGIDAALKVFEKKKEKVIVTSAMTGDGCKELTIALDKLVPNKHKRATGWESELPATKSKKVAKQEKHAKDVALRVRKQAKFAKLIPAKPKRSGKPQARSGKKPAKRLTRKR